MTTNIAPALTEMPENQSTLYIDSDYTFTSDIYEPIEVIADNIVIDGNGYNLQGPGYGYGFYLYERSNVTIKNVVVKGFSFGMFLIEIGNCTLTDNNVTSNRIGIWLLYGGGNILKSNHMTNNSYNFGVEGVLLERDFINDIDTSNTADGKPIYYFVNQRDLVIDSSTFPNIGYLAIINSTRVTVKDVTLTNNMQGVLLAYTTNSTIKNINASNNWVGIDICFSFDNRIAENHLSSNRVGIRWALGSSRNTFSDNQIISNYSGFSLCSEGNNTLRRNSMIDNTIGFSIVSAIGYDGMVWPDSLSDFINDIDTSNTIDGKPIYYLINQENLIIDPSTFPDIGYLALINSTNITVKDLTLTEGLTFAYTANSTIQNVNVSHTEGTAIWLFSSNSNVISNSIISRNWGSGIWIRASSGNTISGNLISNNGAGLEYSRGPTAPVINNVVYHNNFIDNTRQVWVRGDMPPEERVTNKWYHPELLEGNYWSDYPGADDGSGTDKHAIAGDGIGDTDIPWPGPDYDYYPLMSRGAVVATMNISPERLNLKSSGEWITACITLPEGYSVDDIDAATVKLTYDDFVSAAEWVNAEGNVLMVKFDRIALRDSLGVVDLFEGEKFYEVTLTVSGTFADGTLFEGNDIITVIKR